MRSPQPVSSTEARVIQEVRAGRQELVGLVAELVACDTTSREPGDEPRDEERLQRLLANRMAGIGAEIDLWEPEPTGSGNRFVPDHLDFRGRPQLIAALRARGDGPTLLLNGHIDAVAIGESSRWSSDPFKADVRDGLLYGRGAADMKGGLAAQLFALECIHRTGVRLSGGVTFCANTDEESSGAGGYAVVARGLRADAGICAEPTGFDVWAACRGTWMATLTVPGRAGHAEMPPGHWSEGGAVNAIERLSLVLSAIRGLREEWSRRPDHRHPLLAPGDIVPTVVHGGEWMVTYPESCSLTLDVLYLPGHVDREGSGAAVGGEVMSAINASASSDAWLAEHPIRWEFICDTVPAEVSETHPLVELLLTTARDIGRPGRVAGFNSWHDAATYTRHGIPTVSFGPGGVDTAHRPNECVPVDDLVDYSCAVALAAMRFCGVAE